MSLHLFPWQSACMLAYEAHEVIRLRLITLAFGGAAACDEAYLMVSEKVVAGFEAGRTFGPSPFRPQQIARMPASPVDSVRLNHT